MSQRAAVNRIAVLLGLVAAAIAVAMFIPGWLETLHDRGLAPWNIRSVERRVLEQSTVSPYPEAAHVELYAMERTYDDDFEEVSRKEWTHRLTSSERISVEATFLRTLYDQPPDEIAACCVPHHFFRYYDRDGKQLGEVSVCFCCSCIGYGRDLGFRKNEEEEFKYQELMALIAKMGVPTDIDCAS